MKFEGQSPTNHHCNLTLTNPSPETRLRSCSSDGNPVGDPTSNTQLNPASQWFCANTHTHTQGHFDFMFPGFKFLAMIVYVNRRRLYIVGIFAPLSKVCKPGSERTWMSRQLQIDFGKIDTSHVTSRIDTGEWGLRECLQWFKAKAKFLSDRHNTSLGFPDISSESDIAFALAFRQCRYYINGESESFFFCYDFQSTRLIHWILSDTTWQ